MKERINICFASDNNYAPYMGMALFSVLRNAGAEETFHFYILDMGIAEENKQKIASLNNTHEFDITYIPIDRSRLSGCDPKKLSLATFGRFFIPELIPQDKVLYLDCDIMVRASLLPMWKTDLAGFYLAGIADWGEISRGRLQERFGQDFNAQEYVNAGVLLINNKKWREEGICETLLQYSIENAKNLPLADQDAINFICRSHKKMLPERWNMFGQFYKTDLFYHLPVFSRMEEEQQHTVIRHFHPWKKNYFAPHREEYISLMKISPWAEFAPNDDVKWIAWSKIVLRYLWRHPFCFLLPKFYKRWKMRGSACLFMDY